MIALIIVILINAFIPCVAFAKIGRQYNDPSQLITYYHWKSRQTATSRLHRQCIRPIYRHSKSIGPLYSEKDGSSTEVKWNNGSGYRFGDFSRSLAQHFSSKVNKLTGNTSYELGDLSRWIDETAKERIQAVKSQSGDYRYEFGDLMLLADSLVKEKAANFAGKDKADDYQFGDVTRTVIQKTWSGEYDKQDVYLALRILAVAGFSLVPAAQLLPLKALIEVFEFGLANDVANRLLPVLATTLDARMKEALTGNSNYQLGDLSKGRLRQHLANFTGKDTYEFGDITRNILERASRHSNEHAVNGSAASFSFNNTSLYNDLVLWDRKHLEKVRDGT
jgi:hypothetical protein